MPKYREGLPPIETAPRMAQRPVDARGYPVPFFVQWIRGEPDFRVMDTKALAKCVSHNLCWLCGTPLYAMKTFTIGPMCAVNRTSAEPPSHSDCAVYAAKACPFLSLPKSKRNEAGLPMDQLTVPGISIRRNPGVTLLWTTRRFTIRNVKGGVLFRLLDEPVSVQWFAQGRAATRGECIESITSGMPLLIEMAEEPVDLRDAMLMYADALARLP